MIYLDLFFSFFKIGCLTFGGGYAMISLIMDEVIAHGWLDAAAFADIAAVSQMTPGPVALNTATYVGSRVAGFAGALAAIAGLALPPGLLAGLFLFAQRVGKKRLSCQSAVRWVRAVATGLIITALLFFVEKSIFNRPLFNRAEPGAPPLRLNPFFLTLALIVLLLNARFKISPLVCLLFSAAAGLLAYQSGWFSV